MSIFYKIFIGVCIIVGGIRTLIDGDFWGALIPKASAILIIALGVFFVLYSVYRHVRGKH